MLGSNEPPYLEVDAIEAVREIYQQYLVQQAKDRGLPPNEVQDRLALCEQDQPVNFDRDAINAAKVTHIEIAAGGGTTQEAAVGAHQAFYEAKGLSRTAEQSPDLATQALLGYVLGRQEEPEHVHEDAREALEQHIQNAEKTQPDRGAARAELLQHLEGAKREVTDPAINPREHVREKARDIDFDR